MILGFSPDLRVNQQNNSGGSYIGLAAAIGLLDILKKLLTLYDAEINLLDEWDAPHFDWAVEYCQAEGAKLLRDSGGRRNKIPGEMPDL